VGEVGRLKNMPSTPSCASARGGGRGEVGAARARARGASLEGGGRGADAPLFEPSFDVCQICMIGVLCSWWGRFCKCPGAARTLQPTKRPFPAGSASTSATTASPKRFVGLQVCWCSVPSRSGCSQRGWWALAPRRQSSSATFRLPLATAKCSGAKPEFAPKAGSKERMGSASGAGSFEALMRSGRLSRSASAASQLPPAHSASSESRCLASFPVMSPRVMGGAPASSPPPPPAAAAAAAAASLTRSASAVATPRITSLSDMPCISSILAREPSTAARSGGGARGSSARAMRAPRSPSCCPSA
jgi:hypothetical protein